MYPRLSGAHAVRVSSSRNEISKLQNHIHIARTRSWQSLTQSQSAMAYNALLFDPFTLTKVSEADQPMPVLSKSLSSVRTESNHNLSPHSAVMLAQLSIRVNYLGSHSTMPPDTARRVRRDRERRIRWENVSPGAAGGVPCARAARE